MPSPIFSIVQVKCPNPKCKRSSYYFYQPIIVCDYCVSDIITDECLVKGEGN